MLEEMWTIIINLNLVAEQVPVALVDLVENSKVEIPLIVEWVLKVDFSLV